MYKIIDKIDDWATNIHFSIYGWIFANILMKDGTKCIDSRDGIPCEFHKPNILIFYTIYGTKEKLYSYNEIAKYIVTNFINSK